MAQHNKMYRKFVETLSSDYDIREMATLSFQQ